MVIVPPILTFVLLVCGVGGVMTFRFVDTLMTTPPAGPGLAGDADPSATSPVSGGAACVVGTWRHAAIDVTYSVAGVGAVHVMGSGGAITFAPDGTGVDDYSGRVEHGTVGGQNAAFEHTGAVPFRYSLLGNRVLFEHNDREIPVTMTVGETRTPGTIQLAGGGAQLSCGTDTLKITYERGGVTSTRVA